MTAWVMGLISVSLLVAGDSDHTVSPPPREYLSCGQASCFLLLSQLGHSTSLAKLDGDFPEGTEAVSLADLSRILRNYGVSVDAWKVSWDEFRQIDGPMICQITTPKDNVGHFHVARWRGRELVVLDPIAAQPIVMSLEQAATSYQKVFSGHVLVPGSAVPLRWRLLAAPWFSVFAVVCLGVPLVIGVWRRMSRRKPNRIPPT